MNLRRTWAVARKETLHVLRDPRSLAMGIAMPILMLLLYGYALTLDVDQVPLVVLNRDETPVSREFVSQFSGSRYFSIVKYVSNEAELEQAIDSRRAVAGLVIPPDFTNNMSTQKGTSVQMILDGSDSSVAMIAAGYAEIITLTYSEKIVMDILKRMRGPLPNLPSVELRSRVWYNENLESRHFIIPGLIAVIMMVIAALLTSLTIAREWEGGTMEQLISTPLKSSELVLGKLVPYFGIGMIDVILAVVMGEILFETPLRGNLALLFCMASIFLAGTLALGMLFSIVTRNQLAASQLAMLGTFLPTFLLSGFMFAIANMPAVVQGITYLVPARYFIFLLRGIYLKGVGLEILALEAGLLTLFGLLMVLLAIFKFKKKLV